MDLRYLRSFIDGKPYTEDLWADGTYLNLYGAKFKYSTNPAIDELKPLKIGAGGYVNTGLIDMISEVAVSGNVNWQGFTIYNLADATVASNPLTFGQAVAVSGNIINDLDYVSGVLQDQIDAITTDYAWEWTEVVSGVAGQDTFDVSPRTFSSLNSRVDIQVFRNDGRVFQNIDYVKLDDHRIQFYYTIPQNTRITVREERTGGSGGGGGGSVDLTNIDVNPQPDTDGLRSLGGTKAWKEVVLKDQVTGDHYSLSVSGGLLLATLIP